MRELENIREELKAIREQLTRLADMQERREQYRNAYRKKKEREATAQDITGTLNAAFKDVDRIRRQDLYIIEKQTAAKEQRQPIPKHLFYNMTLNAGYNILRSNGEYYFIKP